MKWVCLCGCDCVGGSVCGCVGVSRSVCRIAISCGTPIKKPQNVSVNTMSAISKSAKSKSLVCSRGVCSVMLS